MKNQKKTIRYYSSIFFNLFALAVLLTAIVVLHQILKKPSAKEETATVENVTIKSIPAIPENTPEPQAAQSTQKEQMAVVDLETKAEIKKPKVKTVKWRKVRRKTAHTNYKSKWAEGPSVEELDNESARQRYLSENKQESEGVTVEPAPTQASYNYETRLPSPQAPMGTSVEELDNESARQYYLQQNKGQSGDLAYKQKSSKNTSAPATYKTTTYQGPDDYIPFERK